MKNMIAALAALVVLAACGSGGGTAGSSPSPSGPAQILFAVLQAKGTGTYQTGGPFASVNDTVLILDPTGAVHAQASFAPRTVPSIPGAGLVLEPEARVAAGSAFFVDGTGMVRKLTPAGLTTDVVHFPITAPSQAVDFAVSPNGQSLVASVLSVQGSPSSSLFQAAAGGTPSALQPTNLPATPGAWPAAVGWDSQGPVLIIDQQMATQWGTRGQFWFGHAAHLVNGTAGQVIGGPDCWAWSMVGADKVVCLGPVGAGPVTVRNAGGTVQLSEMVAASDGNFAASPDGTRLAYSTAAWSAGTALLHAFVVGAGGFRVQLPDDFAPQGWLDANRVIGVTYPGGVAGGEKLGNLATVDIGSPGTLKDLGVKGSFVGVLG